MVQPINVRAINQGLRRWPINSTTNLGAGGAVDAYLVNSLSPDTVADFAGVNNSGTEYYRVAGSETTFDDMFTYTGASNKTMEDSDGNLKWAPHNLLTYSNTFDNVAWTKSNCSVVGGVSDPDGGSSAWTLTATANNGFLYQATSFPTGSDVTNGIWVRRRTGTGSVELRSPNNTTGNTLSVTSEWQLFGFEGDSNNIGSVRLSLATNGDAVDIYAARVYRSDLGGMVNNPDRGDSYVPTTSAAVYLPRRNHYRYNGSSFVKKGILLESAAATNLITYSNTFTDASWTKTRASITAAATTSPDGTSNASKIVEDATAADTHYIQETNTGLTSTSAYTFSVYVKAAELSWVALECSTESEGKYFNLSTGAVGGNLGSAPDSARIEAVGNSWYRCSITITASATSETFRVYLAEADGDITIDGDSASGIYVYGAQVELGAVGSSYIPTFGATATRAAETLTIAGSNMAYSATAMSFHMQGEVNYTDKNDTSECWLMRWYSTSVTNDRTLLLLDTSGALTGGGSINSRVFNPCVETEETQQLTPGINKAFNFAARVTTDGSTTGTVNIASNGTSASGTTNAEDIIADLSNEPCMLFYNDPSSSPSTGTIALFRQADVDWTDTGIEEATS